MATIAISDELAYQAKLVAARAGYSTPESLIEEAIRQKLVQLQAEESQRLTQRIRNKMQEKGISEEEIVADFERFRQSLLRETQK
jgi:4-hydroxy-3-methylbut-2-enyl diphosphate reductase IspH